MDKNEATEKAKTMLRQYGQSDFDVPLGNKADYDLVQKAFTDLGCRTEPNGELSS